MARCECEHICHYEHEVGTPKGRPGHLYTAGFDADELVAIPSDLGGRIAVCVDCALDCHCHELEDTLKLIDGAAVAAFLARVRPSECR